MAEFLLELLSEEIPARMQGAAARDLERLFRDLLAKAELPVASVRTFAGPRRLTLVADGLPTVQADRSEERKGPRVGAPEAAMAGFLRYTGLQQSDLVERDGVWFATIARPGRPTPQILAESIEAIVRGFPWPKSMTWGTGRLRWVRPLRSILCVFDGEIVPLGIDGIEAGDRTVGHRVMGESRRFTARSFDEYAQQLAAHYVILEADERKRRILAGARTVCGGRGLQLVEDEGLLDEVAGLSEWPVAVLGNMDPSFLDLPPEVIRTSMAVHQRYFAVREEAGARLAPHFVVVANIEAPDGGALIAAGNARVLSARLSDAKFFWGEDLATPFDNWLADLQGVTFHARLGTMAQRVQRITALSRKLAVAMHADADLAERAGRLCKADLASYMVDEFPELQGVMGGYYAREAGEDAQVAGAISTHYRPLGPGDTPPMAPVAVAVALADKLDTLCAFFAIDERPTGSRDPYALRRAALGVIRTLLQNGQRLDLWAAIADAVDGVLRQLSSGEAEGLERAPAVQRAVFDFFIDRLKVLLREQGRAHDLVDAVLARPEADLVRIVAKVEALSAFLQTDDGRNLLAGHRRATNILAAEGKAGPLPEGPPARMAAAPQAELALIDAVNILGGELAPALSDEDFQGAMRSMSALREPVDAFFDQVLVNSPDPAERDNRLRLLIQVRDAMAQVADFSLVTG
jgi:glycyl-tRNA synthetase beta chain